jgi:hypothetical protein
MDLLGSASHDELVLPGPPRRRLFANRRPMKLDTQQKNKKGGSTPPLEPPQRPPVEGDPYGRSHAKRPGLRPVQSRVLV